MPRLKLLKKLALLSLTGCMIGVPCMKSLQAEESNQEVLDGLAAVVNDDVITFSQVRELVAAREDALRHTYENDPKTLQQKIMETRLAAVNDLIDRQLILQEFKKNKYSIPEYVIDGRHSSAHWMPRVTRWIATGRSRRTRSSCRRCARRN
jgi:hypothetical protein